jgi:integrase
MVKGKVQPDPKTRAGNRVVDLDPALNSLLHSLFANRESRLFPSSESTYRRRISEQGIKGFHGMRRFRITHLQGLNAPPALIKFWAGHAATDVTERYTKMGSQIDERKSWSEKAGVGFNL